MHAHIYAYKICAYHRREVERETLNKQDAGDVKITVELLPVCSVSTHTLMNGERLRSWSLVFKEKVVPLHSDTAVAQC